MTERTLSGWPQAAAGWPLLLVSLASCTTSPLDGQSTSQPWSSRPTLGVGVAVPEDINGPFELYAANPTTFAPGARKAILSETEGTVTQWGQRWKLFKGTMTFEPTDGIAGRVGRAMVLRPSAAIQVFPRQDYAPCKTLVSDFTDFSRQCSGPPPTVCTDDYVPAGSRAVSTDSGGRVVEWQIPGPRYPGCPYAATRLLMLSPEIEADTLRLTPARGPSTTTFSLMKWPGIERDYVRSQLRIDPVAYLELHDSDLNSTEFEPRYGTRGSIGGHFRRTASSAASVQSHVMNYRPNAPDDGYTPIWDNARTSSWQGVKTIKYYDGGTCSVILPWRTLLNEIVAHVEPLIAEGGGGGIRAQEYTRHVLTPVLRTHAPDLPGIATENTQGVMSYTVGIVAQGEKYGLTGSVRATLNMVVTVGFRNGVASSHLLKFALVKTDGNVVVNLARRFGIVDVDEQLADMKAGLEGRIPDMIDQLLARAGAGVLRSNYRPEGIELVLLDDYRQPQFAILDGAGLCGPQTGVAVGMWGGHFDPPSPEDLALAWDTKNPRQRLRTPTNLDELRDCWAADGAPLCGLFRRDHRM